MKLLSAALLGTMLTGVAAAASPAYQVSTRCGTTPRCFPTLQGALDAAAGDRSTSWTSITIAPGTYREKPVVRRDRVRITGAGADRTRIVFGAVAETAGRYDPAQWGTPGSATLTIHASDVTVRGLTIENDFDYLANDALAAGDSKKVGASQGVALLLDTDSDRVAFDGVSLLGYQDTLFTRGRRAWFRRGLIAGNVDFIFGSGMLLIEDSEIRSRRRAQPTPPGEYASFITAPSTPLSQPIGIVIHRSRLTREAGVADGSVALGRPWHPTTRFPDGRYADPQAVGQASFLDCTMDAHIHPDHWTSMAGTARDGTKTAIFRPEESRFSESGSTGPGARRNPQAIRWTAALPIAAVRARLFEGWQQKPGR
ncbi:pectinesterase family protein [Sphingomonas elodea]|uniref:pectinesterase family protein n=1 Tax=Sphingomonas elodea TaxID=179878 RepID=UPI0002630452|nr:pectinesterase family protein [Sphingomonas elodea]